MSGSSMLKNDRRNETYWFVLVLFMLFLQISPIFKAFGQYYKLIDVFLEFVGCWSIGLAGLWSLFRFFRLLGQRPVVFQCLQLLLGLFSAGFVVLFLMYMQVPLAFYAQYDKVLGFGYIFFILVSWQVSCSFIYLYVQAARPSFQKLGIPIFKPAHLLIFSAGLVAFLMSLKLIAFALFGMSYFLGIRYSYNRWIYMKSTHYPFEASAARRFIKRAS